MKFFCTLLLAALATTPGLASAVAPELKVSRSVIVHATPAQVWQRIMNFDGFATWHPGIAQVRIVSGAGNAVGAQRQITLASGATAIEQLTGFDPKHHRFHVRMIGGTLPVSGYSSTIGIKAAGHNRSKVTWSGQFRRKDVGMHPAPAANDAAATAAIRALYRAGLDNLKTTTVGKTASVAH